MIWPFNLSQNQQVCGRKSKRNSRPLQNPHFSRMSESVRAENTLSTLNALLYLISLLHHKNVERRMIDRGRGSL